MTGDLHTTFEHRPYIFTAKPPLSFLSPHLFSPSPHEVIRQSGKRRGEADAAIHERILRLPKRFCSACLLDIPIIRPRAFQYKLFRIYFIKL